MYNSNKVIPGIIIFVLMVTFPIWLNHGKAVSAPKPILPEGRCVESKEFMRANHMELLKEWRVLAIREGMRIYTSSDGSRFWISLQNGCMKCHHNKQQFCDKCHDFASVKPYCWNCHISPETKEFGPAKATCLLKLFRVSVDLREGAKPRHGEHGGHGEMDKRGGH